MNAQDRQGHHPICWLFRKNSAQQFRSFGKRQTQKSNERCCLRTDTFQQVQTCSNALSGSVCCRWRGKAAPCVFAFPEAQVFICARQRSNGFCDNPCLDGIDCIAFIQLLTRHCGKKNGSHGWRNHVLPSQEVTVCWESEIRDDLFWQWKETFSLR